MEAAVYKEIIRRFSKPGIRYFRHALADREQRSNRPAQVYSRTTSPNAIRRWTLVIRIFTSSPTFVPGTNTTKF